MYKFYLDMRTFPSETQEQSVNRLHNRHLAKLLTQLKEIEVPLIVIQAIKNQMSRYTTDIKEQVLKSNQQSNDGNNQI